MARNEHDGRIGVSVLDRLIDSSPATSQEAPVSRSERLRRLKESVRRDLEWLLNTRRLVCEIPAELKETLRSLATYGVSDFSAMNPRNLADRELMRHRVHEAVRTFEPRLRDVVVAAEDSDELDHKLHFRIHAYLDVDPAPEQVSFSTILQLSSAEFEVLEEQ